MADYYNNELVIEQANEITALRAQLAARDAEVARLRQTTDCIVQGWDMLHPAGRHGVSLVLGSWLEECIERMRAALKGEG